MQGVDFFFSNRAHALKFINFVQNVVPMRYRSDKQLVSHNEHSSTYNYKYTFSVEIVPICRVSSNTLWQCLYICIAAMHTEAAVLCRLSLAQAIFTDTTIILSCLLHAKDVFACAGASPVMKRG